MVGWKQTIGSDGPNSPQAMTLRILGFALLRGWPFLLAAIAENAAPSFGAAMRLDTDWLYGANVLALSITLLLLATFSQRSAAMFESQVAPVLASASLAVGSLVVWIGVTAATPAFMLCGCLAAGFGCGFLNLFWANFYARLNYRAIVTELPLAICVGSLFAIAGSAVSPVVLMALSVLVPIAMIAAILVLQMRYSAKALYEPINFNFEKIGASMALSLLAIAFIGGTARVYSAAFTGSSIIGEVPLLVGNIIGAALVLIVFRNRDTVDFGILMKCALVLLAVSVLAVPVVQPGELFGTVVLVAGFPCFRMFTWVLLLLAAKSNHISATKLVGFGWGLVSLGDFCGMALFSLLDMAAFDAHQISLAVAVATVVIIVAMLVPFDAESFTRTIEESGEDALQEESLRQAGLPGKDKGQGGQQDWRPTFKDRCDQIAQQYSLTPKETEIMFLMARGYSGAHLCEKLVLSRSTISTHQQHIYRKMNIHSKRELLDLLDGNL